jgi:rhodanese-related sulfurtransferase
MEIKSDWDQVMNAYRVGTVGRVRQNAERNVRYQEVFGSKGEKTTCEEILKIFKAGGFIIDVRNPVDLIHGGKIHNSVNVPTSQLINWCNANDFINLNTPILLYSNEGNSAETALKDLSENNYANVTNIGTHKWYNICS